jgi:heterodisulfide reductase subunit C
METGIHEHHGVETLGDRIFKDTDVSVVRCYQCGKCSAGCPLSEDMDYPPSVIMRMLQVGLPDLEDKVLRSYTIWLCLACETCYTRCPMEIDIPKAMDFLRSESIRQKKVNPKAKDIIRFHRSFLDSIQYTGRLFEIGLIVDYKMRSRHLLQDVILAPGMFLRGKLHLIPEMLKDKKAMNRLFTKTLKSKEVTK